MLALELPDRLPQPFQRTLRMLCNDQIRIFGERLQSRQEFLVSAVAHRDHGITP